jgi:hypothetical protein
LVGAMQCENNKKMDSNKDIKEKVTNIVNAYIKSYPVEYAAFQKQQKLYRDNLKNKWAELKGSDVMVRELNRYPETLAAFIKLGLSDAEYLEFRETKMQLWFGNTFADFRVTIQKL